MSWKSDWLWTAAALTLLVPSLLRDHGVAFQPAEGSSRRKSFLLERSMRTDASVIRLGGHDVESTTGVVTHLRREIVVLDEYAQVGEGRPNELVRTYETVERSGEAENVPYEVTVEGLEDFTSELEGHTVVFRWQEDVERYEARFAEEDDGESDWLAGLLEDMDLRVLLPSQELSEGGSWEIELEDFVSVLQPGGDLFLEPEGTPGVEVGRGRLWLAPHVSEAEAEQEMDGEVSLLLQGEEVREEVRLAKIELSFEGETEWDALDRLIEAADEAAGEFDLSLQRCDVTLEMEGEGTLLWDVESDVSHSFQLEAEVAFAMEAAWVVDFRGDELPFDLRLERSGRLRIEMQGEVPE